MDGRADQFALAAMTYELLGGVPAFAGENLPAVLYAVVHADPPPLASHGADAPPAVEEVLRIALAKDPAARFASILEMAQALEHAARLREGESFARSELSGVRTLPGRAAPARAPQATVAYPGTGAASPRAPAAPSRPAVRPVLAPNTLSATVAVPRMAARQARWRSAERSWAPSAWARGC